MKSLFYKEEIKFFTTPSFMTIKKAWNAKKLNGDGYARVIQN